MPNPNTPKKTPNRSIATQLKKGYRPQGGELSQADVGREICRRDGFGPVLAIDVGKRIWLRSYGVVMENNDQRDARKVPGLQAARNTLATMEGDYQNDPTPWNLAGLDRQRAHVAKLKEGAAK